MERAFNIYVDGKTHDFLKEIKFKKNVSFKEIVKIIVQRFFEEWKQGKIDLDLKKFQSTETTKAI